MKKFSKIPRATRAKLKAMLEAARFVGREPKDKHAVAALVAISKACRPGATSHELQAIRSQLNKWAGLAKHKGRGVGTCHRKDQRDQIVAAVDLYHSKWQDKLAKLESQVYSPRLKPEPHKGVEVVPTGSGRAKVVVKRPKVIRSGSPAKVPALAVLAEQLDNVLAAVVAGESERKDMAEQLQEIRRLQLVYGRLLVALASEWGVAVEA